MNLEKLFQTQKVLRDRIGYNEPDRFNKLILLYWWSWANVQMSGEASSFGVPINHHEHRKQERLTWTLTMPIFIILCLKSMWTDYTLFWNWY
jgi:hypothetical protein